MKSGKTFFLLLMLTLMAPWCHAEDGVIKIGVPTPLTGIYSSDALGYRQCLEFAVDEINTRGGLLGKKLEIITYDIGVFSPERLLAAAITLIENQHVDTIQAGWSGWGQNVRVFGNYDVPTFFADASISSIKEFRKDPDHYANIFQMAEVEYPLAVGVLDMMNALPWRYDNRKIVIIVTDDEWGYQIGKAIQTHASDKGWEVAMLETVPYGIQDWDALLRKIRKINPAWIHLEVVSPADVIAFVQQFREAPTRSLINLGYGLMPPMLVKTMGREADGLLGKVVFTMPLPNGPTHEADLWLQRFHARYGNVPLAAGYTSYVSLKMWADAVSQVGNEKEYGKINRKLSQMTYKCIAGGIWKFNRDHKIPMSENTPMLGMQIQNGKMVTICRVPDKDRNINRFEIPPWLKPSANR